MTNTVIIEMQEAQLDDVVGGRGGRTAVVNTVNSYNRSVAFNYQRTNNASVYLANMTANAGTSGDHNVGGLAISITQGIQ
jgi:hypothetical protein